jgi:hypothetical protein
VAQRNIFRRVTFDEQDRHEPIDIIQSRHNASIGVGDAARRTPETQAALDGEKAVSYQRDAAALGVNDSAQPIGADIKINLAWH